MKNMLMVKMDTEGKIIIPDELRKMINVEGEAQFVVVLDGNGIYLSKITEPSTSLAKRFDTLSHEVQGVFAEKGISEKDVEEAIGWARNREANCQVDTQQMFGGKMLTDKEFWERVKNLEGETIYSLTKGRRNKIEEVNDKHVFTEDRKTSVSFNGKWGLYENYRILHDDGRFLISSKGGNASGAYFAMAIILAAVPDEAIADDKGIKSGFVPRLSDFSPLTY